MPRYDDYSQPVRDVIDQAIRAGVEMANGFLEDKTHEELMILNVVPFVYDQCCVALALILSAHENGAPDYVPQSMRLALHERLCDNIRVTC